MIVWLWDAPPRGGVSSGLGRGQEAAGALLASGCSLSARVEAAILDTSGLTLEPSYIRTGQAWQARRTVGGVICWVPCGQAVQAR